MLPWDPVSKPVYSVYLKAIGGTGSFNWMCNDSSLCSVNALHHDEQSRAIIVASGQGKFLVHATDAHISTFTGSAEVSLQLVAEMQFLKSRVEVELNQSLILPLAMYGYNPGTKERLPFSNCSEIPILSEIDEPQKFAHINDNVLPVQQSACRNIHLESLALGFNRLKIRIKEDTLIHATIIIACYRKLKAVYPSKEAVLGIGSMMDMIFEGGPRFFHRGGGYYANTLANVSFAKILLVKNESDNSDMHKVTTFCKGFGEDVMIMEVGNKPSEIHPYPAHNEATLRIACTNPDTLILIPLLPSVPGRKCAISSNDEIAIRTSQDLEIELVVKDKLGRNFHNISSFDVKWYLSDDTLAYLEKDEGVKVKFTKFHDMKIKVKNMQTLHLNGDEGSLKVTVSITGYKSVLLENEDLSFDNKNLPVINGSLNFKLVEEAEIQPKTVSVFNSPSNKVYLNITKGSGHFHVEASDESKAKVIYKESTQQIEVTPLDTGSFSITLIDLCLGKVYEAVAHVQIYGISAVVVDVLDKVELGKSIIASVEILNEEKQRIPASMFSLMNLQSVVLQNAIHIRLASVPESHQFQALYTVTGLSLGQTSFKIVTNADVFKGKQYSSEVQHIQVFPPLQLNPDHITLIVGATFQVLSTGGPQPQTGIVYSVDDKDVAAISVAGIIEAKKLGETIVIAKSVGYDKKGNTVTYSQDKAVINCILLKEIKIHSPLSRMLAGTEMPLYAMGINEQETPFTFGATVPSVKFRWSVSNDKVASLDDDYSKMGLEKTSENSFRVRVRAHQDGLVTVHLEVTLPNESSQSFYSVKSQVLTNEVQIQVFKKLKLTNPDIEDGVILLSQNSQLQLKCNRLGPAKVQYTIQKPEKAGQVSVVSVTQQGILAASSRIGSAVLLVTAIEEFGITQSLTVIVKVAEVAYMMINPSANIKTKDWPLTTLPVGFTIPIDVTYHDNIGEVFDAVRSQMKFRASRYNLARISFGPKNHTLVVQVVKPGYTVLKVWDEESPIPADYIKIVAGPAIDPSDMQLTVGDVICFGSPLLTQEGHSGTWSSDSHILSIHPTSGGAIALSPGTSTVTYSLLSGFNTATHVTIKPAAYISIDPGSINHISNVPRAKPYKIPIVVQNNDTHRMNNVIGRNCSHATETLLHLPLVQPPFLCELNLISSTDLNVNDIFQSFSGFDIEKGMYFCSIEPVNKVPISDISNMEGQLALTVHLESSDHRSSLSQQHMLSFLPAFFVQQEELLFYDRQYVSHLTISATQPVQRCIAVSATDPTVLKIESGEPNSSLMSFRLELVSVPNMWRGEITSLHVDINCALTKQHVRLPVKLKKTDMTLEGGSYCPPLVLTPAENPSYTMYDWYWMLTVMSSVLAIIIVFYICRWCATSRRGVVTTQNVFLDRSNGSHNFSPNRFSPNRSSFTPSPYSSPFSSPPQDYGNLSGPLRMCTLDSSPQALHRRRSDNVFQ